MLKRFFSSVGLTSNSLKLSLLNKQVKKNIKKYLYLGLYVTITLGLLRVYLNKPLLMSFYNHHLLKDKLLL